MIPFRASHLCLPLPFLVLLPVVLAPAACTGSHAIAQRERIELPGVSWFAPELTSDQEVLARWSAAVGPPVIRAARAVHPFGSDTLSVVSWNTAVGAGDVGRFLRDLRVANPRAHVVLLLQEVYRGGPEVPGAAGSAEAIRFAGRLGAGAPSRHEVEWLAETTGLNLYYVPSMRNGSPRDSDEDRGNAILSTLPLCDFAAIELPFERQRRVAVAATVVGRTADGQDWRLRVVSSHLDNLVGVRRGWLFGGQFARVRQARALLEYVRTDTAVVLGGDFNTWFGIEEPAYKEILQAFPDSDSNERRPTFMGLLRLDHLFFRLPHGWKGRFRRAAERYGSDHYPLVATITISS